MEELYFVARILHNNTATSEEGKDSFDVLSVNSPDIEERLSACTKILSGKPFGIAIEKI